MNTLREAAQQALEYLDAPSAKLWPARTQYRIITALRAALAQQAEPDAYSYASLLAIAIWEKHYKGTAPQWKPLNDLMGVLTQIDNMTSGLTRQEQAEPVEPVKPVKPVKPVWIQPDHLQKARAAPFLCRVEPTQRFLDFVPLYTAPPQRMPLTEEEIKRICASLGFAQLSPVEVARAVERAHGIGEQE